MPQETAIEEHGARNDRERVPKMVARHGAQPRIFLNKRGEIASGQHRIRARSVHGGELAGELALEYGFQRTAAVLEDMNVDDYETLGSGWHDEFVTHVVSGPPATGSSSLM